MVQIADQDAIDTLAATLFSLDHPDRCWDPLEDHRGRLGVASALDKAVYRGFARGRIGADKRMVAPEVAAAALASEATTSIKSRA